MFYAAALTPVTADGAFDEPLMRDLLAFLDRNGTDGVLALGTTGEFSAFSVPERKRILDSIVRHKRNLRVMAHVGGGNVPDTLELLEHATRAGVEAALVLPPYYFKKPDLEGLVAFYSPILRAAKIPVLLYHIPSMSDAPITLDLLNRLSSFEMLAGVKDSSGSAEGLLAFIKEFPKLRTLTGSPRLLSMSLEAGGAGCITGNGNVIPQQTAAVVRAFRAGQKTTEAQARLDEASKAAVGDIPSMKYALGELGMRPSHCRPPFVSPSDERKAEIRTRMAALKKGTA